MYLAWKILHVQVNWLAQKMTDKINAQLILIFASDILRLTLKFKYNIKYPLKFLFNDEWNIFFIPTPQ